MSSKQRRVEFKDTVHENILLHENQPQTKRNKTANRTKRSHTKTKWNDSGSDSSDIDKESGFESVVLNRKKVYYKKIKHKNKKRREKELHRKRIEYIIKFILYVFSNCINILAVVTYIIETFFNNLNDATSLKVMGILQTIDVSFSFYFIFEYILLFTRVQKGILNHIFSWDTFIDLITIGPSVVTYFIGSLNLNFLRIFRIFRVFRILRIYKSLRMIQHESSNNDDENENSDHLKFDPIKLQFFTIMVVLICVFIIGAGLILGLQDIIYDAWSLPNMNFFDAIYFMIVTYVTLGYGDILPTHTISRMMIIVGLFCLIVIISDQLSKMANLLTIWGPGWRVFNSNNHLVVICDATINLELFLQTIKAVDPNEEVIIISQEEIAFPSQEFPYNKVHTLKTNTFDFETFERANTRAAKAIFIFSSKSTINCDQKEKVTDFLILKINRFYGEIPVYVQTLYSERSFTTDPGSTNLRKPPANRLLKFKKIIPIMRIKSLIMSKASFNPGFSTFIQNLMFNDYELPVDLTPFSSVIVNYLHGCENKLHIRPMPSFFEDKEFFDACHMLYFRSIREFFTKITTLEDICQPVLLIGLVNKSKIKIYNKEEVMFFPHKTLIKKNMSGIFISFDDGNYLNNILNSFEENKRGHTILVKDEIETLKRRGGAFGGDNSESEDSGEDKISKKDRDSGNFSPTSDRRVSQTILQLQKLESLAKIDSVKTNLQQIHEESDEDSKRRSESNQSSESLGEFQSNMMSELALDKEPKSFVLGKVPGLSSKAIARKSATLYAANDDGDLVEENDKEEVIDDSEVNKRFANFLRQRNRRPSIDYKMQLFNHKGKRSFGSDATNKNIEILKEAEEQNGNSAHHLLDKYACKRYGNNTDDGRIERVSTISHEYFIESRIFDLAKINMGEIVSSHILIVGYQDNISKLLKLLTNHFPSKDICIFSKNDDDRRIHKVMRQFKNLLYFKGETENPFHLLNAGLNKAYICIFLCETLHDKTKEDMGKILSFKSIDYFFNSEMILELWSVSSTRFLGYQPLGKDLKIISNEFLHPIYMAGRVIYLSHLDKLLAKSYNNDGVVEIWNKLISLGFSTSSTSIGFKTLMGNKDSFPVILTIDIPEDYVNKEYHTLFNDLLLLDNPALCLGIYVENPLDYLTLQSQGRVLRMTRKQTDNLKITTSHKRKLVNLQVLDKVEQSYKDNLRIIRDISYNDRVILDYVDINKSHLPIFITNPYPGFMLNERCKMMVLYHFSAATNPFMKSPKKNDKERSSIKYFQNQQSMSSFYENKKLRLSQSQDNFFCYYDMLKQKVKGKYADSFRHVEREKNNFINTQPGFKYSLY